MSRHGEAALSRRWWAALALLPVITLGFRALGFFPSVIDWDESLYILQAREWLRGGWPLVAVWDLHPVGAPAMFAVAMALLGESIAAIRALGVLSVSATGWALFFLVRGAGGPPMLGYAAAVLYAGHSVLMGGMAVNTELLFAPFVTAALALAVPSALHPDRRPEWWRVAAMGALMGWAMTIKTVAMPEGCLAFLLLVLGPWRRGALRLPRLAGFAAVYAALSALPSVLFGVAYWWMGELATYLDSTLFAPFVYAQAGLPLGEGMWRVASVAVSLLWLFLLAGGALALLRRDPLVGMGLLWLGAATVAIMLPQQFFPHYFLIWLAPLSLLGALGAHALARYLAPAHVGLCLALVTMGVSLDPWRQDTAPRLWRGAEIFEPDTPARIAALIEEEMPGGEPIFIANYQPILYFLSRAGLPTRFPFPLHLTGAFNRLAGSDTDQELLRILDSYPRFIIVDRGHWDAMRPNAARVITEALEAHYELAYVFPDSRAAIELWRIRGPDPESE